MHTGLGQHRMISSQNLHKDSLRRMGTGVLT